MFGGLYAAASGMEAQQTQFDALSNDIANVDTPGYQAVQVGFHDLLYTTAGYGEPATGAGAAADVIGRDLIQGPINPTGRPLDVAISGEGYIEVRRPDGSVGLTRNGTLQLNAQGQLTNELGMPLQPPITVPAGTDASQVSIKSDGTVSVSGRPVGQIQLVSVPAPSGLTADGDSIFSPTAASGAPRAATAATLQQGALEGSNVDLAQVMSQMVQAQQSYSMGSRAVQFQDQMLQIANQIKR